MSDIKIFGRQYKFLTQFEADTLEDLRANCFAGFIDANTCERECYNSIFKDYIFTYDTNNEIYGVIKRISHPSEIGSMWIANHSKKTLTYDGMRSMKVAETLKHLGNEEYPFLLSRNEYQDIIKFYSKYYGFYSYRAPGSEISAEEYEYAKQTLKDFEQQLLVKRRNRTPKFGDTVMSISGQPARYIGKGQALIIEGKKTLRDLVDMEVEWPTEVPDLATDEDLVKFLKDNSWV